MRFEELVWNWGSEVERARMEQVEVFWSHDFEAAFNELIR